MPRILRKFFGNSRSGRLIFALVIMTVSAYFAGRFIFVRASGDQVNIYPDSFVLEQGTSTPSWDGVGLAFYQDLPPQAGFDLFNQSNSAFAILKTDATSTGTAATSADASAGTTTIEAIVETPAIETAENPAADVTASEAPVETAPQESIAPAPGAQEQTPAETMLEAPMQTDEPAPAILETAPQPAAPEPSSNKAEPAPAPAEIAPTPAETAPVEPAPATSLLDSFKLAGKGIAKTFSKLLHSGQARADDEPAATQPKQSIIFSGFSVPAEQTDTAIDNVQLRLSMAGRSSVQGDKILVEYATDGASWNDNGFIDLSQETSNAVNGGYYLFAMPTFGGWEEIGNLKVKVSYVPAPGQDGLKDVEAYIDALWLETNTKEIPLEGPEGEVKGIEEKAEIAGIESEFDFAMLSGKKDFKVDERPSFKFNFKKKRGMLGQIGAGLMSIFVDEYKDIKIDARMKGGTEEMKPVVSYLSNGDFTVEMPKMPRQIRPGKQEVEITVIDQSLTSGQPVSFIQDFTWGVLAFNVSKSIYLPSETAYFQMGVVDDAGHTVCNAKLSLEIMAPDGGVAYLNSENGLIVSDAECGLDNVIKVPDYYAYYGLAGAGVYQVKMTAITANGARTVNDQFEVRDAVPFEIERLGPTRIFPKADYEMKLIIRANEDYSGNITDLAPASFKVYGSKVKIKPAGEEDYYPIESRFSANESNISDQLLLWQDIRMKKGDTMEATYIFDAPDVSPEFFLLGPAQVGGFMEIRNWQIASDAVDNRAKTVEFVATPFNGTGAAGQNTNTNQTFTNFSFQLAETGVTIKNAYVVFESQFEAYADNNGSYTGYILSFDSCQEPCTANAFTGTSTASTTDTTVLAYNETGSTNHVRLLLDVTDEANLAAYTGTSTMDVQIGYRINFGATVNSIASAKARLVVTYLYDPESTGYTNTVYYPLESAAGGDSGSRRASQATGCTLGTNCPNFNYTMDIPEFTAASSTKLSQWFKFYNQDDAHTTNDFTATVKIGASATSPAFIMKSSVNPGDHGNTSAAFFDNVAGFSENSAQTIGYRPIATNGVFYMIGGEVAETYTASTSAPTKTRTVSFPIGVINNGGTTSLTSGSIDVVLPENGLTSTGTVAIKKAWVRLISNNYNTSARTVTVSTQVGDNAQSGNYVYNYNPGTNVDKPSFDIIHVIPSSDYAELENANASTTKTITINTTNSTTEQGAMSAELMITYAYTDESNGYLASLSLFAGQSKVNSNAQSTTTPTSLAVFPETVGSKTLRGAVILSSHHNTDFDQAVIAGIVNMDANLATGTPVCSNARISRPDGTNSFSEFYKNVYSAMDETNNQSYNACYSNNGGGDSSGGAKMNGQLIYTYSWKAPGSPTGYFNSIAQKMDGSGDVDISIDVDDPVQMNCKAKIEYVSGSDCNFASPGKALISTSTITSDFGTVVADNASAYQVGTSSGWIITSSGANTVNFDWQSKVDLPTADGVYCVRLTASNGTNDQNSPDTTLVTIDNVAPTAPGQLSATSTGTTVTLTFGSQTTENHFSSYKIFYKKGTSSVSEADSELVDSDLGYQDYNDTVSSVARRLDPDTDYVFNIWAYDTSGNRASSTEITIRTQAASLRANTVKFQAGIYNSSDGITGQNTNATNTLPDFNFKLMEKEIEIRSAYIVFETQFEAYVDGAEIYDSYSMSFDACSGACTPVATSGLVKYDDTVVAYNETAVSNISRFLMDVTDEPDIRDYAGEGLEMSGQFAYMFHKTTAANSIANAKAYLVLTYTFDQSLSESFTNTVSYPLESTVAGDSGTRRGVLNVVAPNTSCVLDSTCPTFSYNMTIPEISDSSQRQMQWFETYGMDDLHATQDVKVDVNIQGTDISSDLFSQEAGLGGTQGNLAMMPFAGVSGFTENSGQQLEYHPVCADAVNGANYYVLGGETFETYIASTSAPTKTRTVSFPMGVISNGNTTAVRTGAKDIYFPENGSGSGNVDIKKAWVRIAASNVARAGGGVPYNLTLATKSGTNATSSNYVYAHRPGITMSNAMFKVFHVIPAADYAELESANASAAKMLNLSVQSSSANVGGISAELVITYSYTDESDGHLSALSLFGGQSAVNPGDPSGGSAGYATTTPTAMMVIPESDGTKLIRAGGIVASYLLQDSDSAVSNPFLARANLSTASNPSCTGPTYILRNDSRNSFGEMYVDVSSVISATDRQQYYACYQNNGGGDTNGGAKMNGQVVYTYQWNAPPQTYTQNDWQWYENIDSVQPTTARGNENDPISNINQGDILRLRMNLIDGVRYSATSSVAFKLQYGWGSDCSTAVGWTDVGTTTQTIASWRSYDNTGTSDGAAITSTLLASSTVAESYEEDSPTAANLKYLSVGDQGEWDWTLYNYSATSSQQYCFRMVESDGTILLYNSDGYPNLVTAAANTAPNSPILIGQYVGTGTSTAIANNSWTGTSTLTLAAKATDVNMSEGLKLYFELIYSTSTFTSAVTEPGSYCSSGTSYDACSSKIWRASSTVIGDFRTNAYVGTTTIPSLPDSISSSTGYMWQVLACDDSSACSNWTQYGYGVYPNVKIDTAAPSNPGSLSFFDKTTTSVTVTFGASTTEPFFAEYKIFYKKAASGVTESDLDWLKTDDANLGYIDYNGATSTLITGLTAGTQYVFNIWAYDGAGNKASGTTELVVTTSSGYNAPAVTMNSVAQKIDGTGAIDMSIYVTDPDNDDTLQARISYAAYDGVHPCASTTDYSYSKATIDPTDANTYAYVHGTFNPAGDPKVDAAGYYQVGTTTGYMLTSVGGSDVQFDWLSKTDIPAAYAIYCLMVVVFDGSSAPIPFATTTAQVFIDNTDPTAPGALTLDSKTSSSIRLDFGAPSVDGRFDRYKIFYSTSSPVSESSVQWVDSNLNNVNYNNATSTNITGLQPGIQYYFNIWAYDLTGNRASSTELSQSTDAIPENATSTIQWLSDGATSIPNAGWSASSTVLFEASANDSDPSEILTLYYQVIANSGTFLTATTVPSNACVSGMDYITCASGVWIATSSAGDYSATPFTATVTIPLFNDSSTGYKWQVLACDDDNVCSAGWTRFNASNPNFKVDTIAPTAPGNLSESAKTANSVDLGFGATTTESNFIEYRVYYATGTPVTESSYLHGSSTDASLGNINFNGASFTTVDNLSASTTYYFAIWAYDYAGNKASSSVLTVTTNNPQSTPGVMFYTKNTRVLFYKTWNGTTWSTEKTGPTFGSGATDYIRHIRSVRSDDGSRVGIIVKTWDTANQEFWGAVYRMAADDFVDAGVLKTAINSANYAGLMDADIAALSSGDFMVLKGNITSAGTTAYSWNGSSGWTNEGAGPNSGYAMTGMKFTRRPNTDNYLLSTYDSSTNVNTFYYYGGSTYADLWTTTHLHSSTEFNASNFVGDAFFDQTDNTRGAINYTGSAASTLTKADYFTVDSGSIAYGSPFSSAGTWTANFVHGEFAPDMAGGGIAFYSGRNSTGELNVFKVDVSGTPSWTAATNGDNISGSALYANTNFSNKPFASIFYKNGEGVVAWNNNVSATPKYRIIDSSANSVDAADTAVPGAAASIWSRVRFVKDPNEQEFLAYYQNSNKDYYAVFWNGASDRFYNSTNNPGSGQVWTSILNASGNFDQDDECTSFSFGKNNSSPYAPASLFQYKSDGATIIANGGWSNTSQIVLKAGASDPDTSEVIITYFNFVTATGTFETSTNQPTGACSIGTSWSSCASKIWAATSTLGDYSVTPYTATTSITSVPDSSTSTAGYKWQAMSCDDQGKCSSWVAFNAAVPNLKIDTVAPTVPGALAVWGKNSYSITLNFGATTTEANFDRYKIFYKAGASGVTESDSLQNDSDLNYINFNNTASTTVTNLASSTQYVFNIWAYDLAGNKASATPEIATTTNAAPFINQVSYLFENDDSAGVNTNTAVGSIDATSTDLYKGERLNLRIQVENSGGDIQSSKVYRLQYENFTDNPGTWNDVGASNEMSYSLGLSGNNGDAITGSKAAANGRTWTYGEFRENTNLSSAFTLANGYYTEFVYAIQTSNANLGKTYRFRLYNNTDARALDSYGKYPALSIRSAETTKFSKGTYAALLTTNAGLTYYLDPKGYSDTASDDSARDALASSANIPVFNFTMATSTNTKALNASWNGQSSVSAGTNAIYLQVYRFGTTNAWVTVATNTSASADTDFTMTANINAKVSEYYDGSNRTYWRVFQASGTQTLRSDYFNITYTDPTPYVSQLHYLWRYDNGTEVTAGSVEPEDYGYPTQASTSYMQIGSTTRLRLEVANTGGGTASNYAYRLEFATTTSNCATDPGGWLAVPTAATAPFMATTSANFANGASTTARMANAEGYTFTAGYMVEYPSNTSGAETLVESRYTEMEYAIAVTSYAQAGSTYCFRVTNSGAVLNAYGKLAELTVAGITNFAPVWEVETDDGGSDATLPTDYGSNVVFKATASTTDEGDYYLAICKTNSVTAGNDAPPTCNGGSWCISPLASSTAEATCSYTTATTSEELAWYSFACDRHPGTGVAKCSTMSQGNYGSGLDSPFNINHAPSFTNIYTSINNQNPGGTFRINATSTDTDTVGGQDAISVFVCSTNSATYAGCTATTVCSIIATTTANPYCEYTAPTPSAAGATTYYAFVYDSHAMAASSNSRSSSFTVNNVAPSISTLFLNNGSDITLNIKGNDTQVQVAATTTDLNGCNPAGGGRLQSATAVIYFSNVSNGYNCVANNNNCYQIAGANCTKVDCSGTTASYICSANMKYYALPTDNSAGNPNVSYNWLGRMTVFDGNNYTSTSSAGVELITTTALDVTENTIDFGSNLFAGQNTGSTNQPSTVVNSGNSPINSNVYGTDMTGNPAGTINVSSIKLDIVNFDWNSTGTPLVTLGDGGITVDIDAKKPTSTADVYDLLYWGVGVPFGSPVSTYSGTNTFVPLIDDNDW